MSISHCYCSDYMTKPTQFGDEPLKRENNGVITLQLFSRYLKINTNDYINSNFLREPLLELEKVGSSSSFLSQETNDTATNRQIIDAKNNIDFFIKLET